MSVTFSIEFLPTGKYEFTCYDANATFGPFDSYDDGLLAATAHKMACTDCNIYNVYVNAIMDVSDEFDINLSNTNAIMILTTLGVPFDHSDLCGNMPADEFLGYVLLALAQDRDDSAVPAVAFRSTGGANWIDCGTPDGYTTGVLMQLEALASEAHRLGRNIVWS